MWAIINSLFEFTISEFEALLYIYFIYIVGETAGRLDTEDSSVSLPAIKDNMFACRDNRSKLQLYQLTYMYTF